MPLVSSPRPVPLWISSTNSRTRMNKFRRCRDLDRHTHRLKKIEGTPTDRIDNKDQIKIMNFSRKCHKSARDASQRYRAQMTQRSNLIVFLNIQDARYGKEEHMKGIAEREKMLIQVNKFKQLRRKRDVANQKRRIRNEKKVLQKRIRSIKPSPYLDRKKLAAAFRDSKTVKRGLIKGKARLRVDSFQIMEQMVKKEKKQMKLYHEMAEQRKTARKKRRSKSRRQYKPELPFKRKKKKKKPPRPKSAKVGLNQSNREAVASMTMAAKLQLENLGSSARLSSPLTARELRASHSSKSTAKSFRPSRVQTASQYIDYAETVDAHEDIPKSNVPRRARRTSQASCHSSPHFAIETKINRLLFTHIMEHDEDETSAITEYLLN